MLTPMRVRFTSGANLVALLVLACAAAAAWQTLQVLDGREAELRSARTINVNLARSLAQHAEGLVTAADTALVGVRYRVETMPEEARAGSPLYELLREHVASLPPLHGLFVFDPRGDVLANALAPRPSPMNYGDRDYFKFHRADPSRALRVSGPFRSKTDNGWILVLSRRVDALDGSFGGVVEATIAAADFRAYYATLNLGSDGVVTLLTLDGTTVVRQPDAPGATGGTNGATDLFRQLAASTGFGDYEIVSPFSGQPRLGGFSRVGSLPLVVAVGRSRASVLARWQNELGTRAAGMAFLLAVIGWILWRLSKQMAARRRAESLYRLLAENSSDAIVCADRAGRLRYASPSLLAMTGWSAEQVGGRSWSELVLPEDRQLLLDALDAVRSGAPDPIVCFRQLLRGGGDLWVEARLRRAGAGGEEVVGNVRDVSVRRRLETRLTRANLELTALAETDGLTGIANRRVFDDTLTREWARARREATCVSVVLLDVDHFKSYNDQHGHLAGDVALKAVAQCLDGVVRRPGDLAARFGGEEFAAILPNTGRDSAVALAEDARRAVAALAIPHAGTVSGILSVSLGVAARVPVGPGQVAGLLHEADTALYAAKRQGRNRVAAAERRDETLEAPI